MVLYNRIGLKKLTIDGKEIIVVLRGYFEESKHSIHCHKHEILIISPKPKGEEEEKEIAKEVKSTFWLDTFDWGPIESLYE